MPGKTKHVFWPFDKFWTWPHVQNFLICMALGGAAIFFAQSWNFELIFCFNIFYMKKIASRVQWVLLSQKRVQNCQKTLAKNFMNGQKKAENDLEYKLFHLEMAWIIFKCLKILEFCLIVDFLQATYYINLEILQWFWLMFWQKNGLTNP